MVSSWKVTLSEKGSRRPDMSGSWQPAQARAATASAPRSAEPTMGSCSEEPSTQAARESESAVEATASTKPDMRSIAILVLLRAKPFLLQDATAPAGVAATGDYSSHRGGEPHRVGRRRRMTGGSGGSWSNVAMMAETVEREAVLVDGAGREDDAVKLWSIPGETPLGRGTAA